MKLKHGYEKVVTALKIFKLKMTKYEKWLFLQIKGK